MPNRISLAKVRILSQKDLNDIFKILSDSKMLSRFQEKLSFDKHSSVLSMLPYLNIKIIKILLKALFSHS